jgi:iron complex outermembrane receptor protein
MIARLLLLVLFTLTATTLTHAQQSPLIDSVQDTEAVDAVSQLDSPRVARPAIQLPGFTLAFDLAQSIQQVPASIGIITDKLIRRSSNTSILSAVNAVPGAHMEERSPGSYRLSMRGSSLRAPFGVRNIKIYYNGIPFTDPGGNTYLNQFGYYNISHIELIKGPGSSLYGAGTGGVALIESLPANLQSGIGLEATAGSYGRVNMEGEWSSTQPSGPGSIVRYQHLSSDGYREHSALRRDVLSWDARAKLSASTTISTHFFYTDLFYETPGALTLAEYEANPRSARPTIGTLQGAIATNAAISQKAFLAGSTLQHTINPHWQYTTTLYGAFTSFTNPTLRNYSRSSEPHTGGRALLKYSSQGHGRHFTLLAGAELQQSFNAIQTYSTKSGNPDTLQSDDKLNIPLATGFMQASLEWRQWLVTGGASISALRFLYARLSNSPYTETTTDFNNEISPRLAIRYAISPQASAYTSIAKGFSPPVSSELSPSGGTLNTALQAEQGWNYEAGLRGTFLHKSLSYDLCAYWFSLTNTIVQRRDSAGGDYYINSGSTEQPGLEAALRYNILHKESSRAGDLSIFTSYTYQHFRYKAFKQLEADYSGNPLPGVAPNTLAAGIDWDSRFGLYARLSYYYSDITSLNDAATATLPAYHLLAARMGYMLPLKSKYGIEIFAGADNLTDTRYSAGPDINAFGGRYYNAAAGRSLYAGVSLKLNTHKE